MRVLRCQVQFPKPVHYSLQVLESRIQSHDFLQKRCQPLRAIEPHVLSNLTLPSQSKDSLTFSNKKTHLLYRELHRGLDLDFQERFQFHFPLPSLRQMTPHRWIPSKIQKVRANRSFHLHLDPQIEKNALKKTAIVVNLLYYRLYLSWQKHHIHDHFRWLHCKCYRIKLMGDLLPPRQEEFFPVHVNHEPISHLRNIFLHCHGR